MVSKLKLPTRVKTFISEYYPGIATNTRASKNLEGWAAILVSPLVNFCDQEVTGEGVGL